MSPFSQNSRENSLYVAFQKYNPISLDFSLNFLYIMSFWHFHDFSQSFANFQQFVHLEWFCIHILWNTLALFLDIKYSRYSRHNTWLCKISHVTWPSHTRKVNTCINVEFIIFSKSTACEKWVSLIFDISMKFLSLKILGKSTFNTISHISAYPSGSR